MAITTDDFNKIWASTSPLTPYEFSESNYKEGWNFIGGTPPSRQMWDFLQKNNDEKMQYLANNYLPLSGGTLTGVVNGVTPTAGDDSTKMATTEFVNTKAGNYLPLSGGTMTGDVLGVTPPNGDNSKKLANTEFIQALANILVPVGCVQAYAGNTTPQGWLLCDGSTVSRTQYSRLFGVIGTTYGAGDGTDTFNLPNLVDKFVEGSATAGTEKGAGLPNITGSMSLNNTETGFSVGKWMSEDDGALQPKTVSGGLNDLWVARTTSSGNVTDRAFTLNASRSSSIYGNSNTVQPPSLTMRYIIKY